MNDLRLVPPGAIVHDVESIRQDNSLWVGRCTCGWTTRSRVGKEWVEGQLQTHLDRDVDAPRIHPICGTRVEREELGHRKYRCPACGARYLKARETYVLEARTTLVLVPRGSE